MELIAGAALGLLVGTLLGLSAEPLVATVMTGLVALLASFFGFAPGAPGGVANRERLIGFCVVAVLSGLVAISARTHNALSPTAPTPQTIQSLVQELKASDIPPSKIVEFVGAKYFGVLPNGSAAPLPPDGKDSLSATKFFAAKANDCNSIPSVADRTLTEKLGYLDSLPGTPFADLSKRIRSFPEDRREAAYDAGILLLCGA